jgi:uncharacterized protein with PIN domain
MNRPTARLWVAEPLRFLLRSRHRAGEVSVPVDGVSTALHLVESLGIPRTEIGELRINECPVPPEARPRVGDAIEAWPVQRPQPVPEPRFLLDVHLGTLARRMRLLGLDVAYRNDADDDELVVQAVAERRVLLTRDRGLLRRRALPVGAYVRGSRPDDQLLDVLDRFDPPLAPWSRCPTCNGRLEQVDEQQVRDLLPEGTRRGYAEFARCRDCRRPYWRGAHAAQLDAIVTRAIAATRR